MIEAAPNDTIRVYFELKDAGLGGLSGESPTIVIRRKRDGLYLQISGGFGGVGDKHPMVEADAADRPGLYYFDFDLATNDPDTTDEYTAYMANDNVATPAKNGSALEALFVKNEVGFTPGSTRGVYLFVANAGSPLGVPGLLPEIAIERESDGRFLDTSLPDFVTGAAIFLPMTEIDASNQPGVYSFDFDQGVDGELRSYVAYIMELSQAEKVVEAQKLDFRGIEVLAIGGLDFEGIEGLTDTGLGSLKARASAVASPYPPVRYKLFVAPTIALEGLSDVFDDPYLLGEFRSPEIAFCTEADGCTGLKPLTSYTVGMRVLDNRDLEDDNTVTITVEVSTSQRTRLSTGSLYTIASPGQAPGEVTPDTP